jgi:hypothetical protein
MFKESFSTIVLLKPTPVSDAGRIVKWKPPAFFEGEWHDNAVIKKMTAGKMNGFKKRIYAIYPNKIRETTSQLLQPVVSRE